MALGRLAKTIVNMSNMPRSRHAGPAHEATGMEFNRRVQWLCAATGDGDLWPDLWPWTVPRGQRYTGIICNQRSLMKKLIAIRPSHSPQESVSLHAGRPVPLL